MVFISFEGGEGSGKSTQARLLAAFLSSKSLPVCLTREPGGSVLAENIRSILLDNSSVISAKSEFLLFAAARADIVDSIIAPALSRNEIVVCDRFFDSSIAYQGFARGLDWEFIYNVSLWASNNIVPDLTFFLDVPPAVGLERAGSTDRLEAEPLEYHEKVREGFFFLQKSFPDRFVTVSGLDNPKDISTFINNKVTAFMGR